MLDGERMLRIEYDSSSDTDKDKQLDTLADIIVTWGMENGVFETFLKEKESRKLC